MSPYATQYKGLTTWETSLVDLGRLDKAVDMELDNSPSLVDIDVGDASRQFRVDFDLTEPTYAPSIYSECTELDSLKAWLLSLERKGLSEWIGYEDAQDLYGEYLCNDLTNELERATA